MHIRHFLSFVALFFLLALGGCASVASTPVPCHRWPDTREKQTSIQMDGPEDLAIDTFHGRPRLIISSLDRRGDETTLGKIFQIDLETKEITELHRDPTEPEEIRNTFRPHGLDLQRVGEETYLYVIVHGDRYEPKKDWVVQYRLQKDKLVYKNHFPELQGNTEEEFFIQSNDVAADGVSGFYVTNSSNTKSRMAYLKWLLRVHSAPTVHYDFSTEKWQRIGSLKIHGNGVFLLKDQLLIADTEGNRISSLSGPNFGSEEIASDDIPLPDNINRGPDDSILITSHDSIFKFIFHSLNLTSSGGSVIRATVADEKMRMHKLFVTDGKAISAPSSAVYYNGALYIGQVFDSFLLEVPVADMTKTYSCGNLE